MRAFIAIFSAAVALASVPLGDAVACQAQGWKRCEHPEYPYYLPQWPASLAFKCVHPSGSSHHCGDFIDVARQWNQPNSTLSITAAIDQSHTPTVGDGQPSASWTLAGNTTPCADCPVGTIACTCLTYSCSSYEIEDADIFVRNSTLLDLGAPPAQNDYAYPSSLPHRSILSHAIGHAVNFRDVDPADPNQVRTMLTSGTQGHWSAGYTYDRVHPLATESFCLADWYMETSVILTATDITLSNAPLASSTSSDWSTDLSPGTACGGDTVSFGYTLYHRSWWLPSTIAVKYYVSLDDVLDGSDLLAKTTSYSPIYPGIAEPISDSLTVPAGVSCDQDYHIIAVADPNGVVTEWNEANNVLPLNGTFIADSLSCSSCP